MTLPEFQFFQAGDLRMRVAVDGPEDGPLVLLAHGWPESWYSWRHQISALAGAGYRVWAPDMRGYGQSDSPEAIESYRIDRLVGDLTGLLDAGGYPQAALVGHDWGAAVSWHAALLAPERFSCVAAMSVPYFGRPERSPIELWKERYGDRFYYILYHQQEGIAEAEYDADPEGLLRMLYTSPDTPREPPGILDPSRNAGGFIGRWGAAKSLPDWLEQADLDYYLGEFSRTGFRGGLNWYRNIEANWRYMAGREAVVRIPALFLVGESDLVIHGLDESQLWSRLQQSVSKLEDIVWLPGIGHWIQQESPAECNRALLNFLKKYHAAG